MENPMKILVVDDESCVRRSMQRILKLLGHSVVLAENGLNALEKFTEQSFDLVITDLSMPVMGGVETIKRLRELTRSLPIIVCTGSRHYDLPDLAAKFAPLFVVEKPFDCLHLEAVVSKAFVALTSGKAAN
jgi:CheY-like chemotaxis protein